MLCAQRLPAMALEPIRQTLGCSYTDVSLIVSVYTLFYAGLSFFWGMLADRIGTRKSLIIACGIASTGTVLFGLFGQYGLPIAIVTWALTGVGTAALLMAIMPKLISKWYAPNRRGFGMSLVTIGGSTTSIILGMVAPAIIVNLGWQYTFVIFGFVFILILIYEACVIRDDPTAMGLQPYGAREMAINAAEKETRGFNSEQKDASNKPAKKSRTIVRVMKMPITWQFGLFYLVFQVGYMGGNQYYVASVQSAGYTLVQSGLAITFSGLLTMGAILVFGHMADVYGTKKVIVVSVLLDGLAMLGYYFYLVHTPAPSLIMCYVFVALCNALAGNAAVIMTAAGSYYPEEIRATGTGFIGTINIVGRYSGPIIAGMVVDATGLVGSAFMFLGIATLVSAAIAATLPGKRTPIR